MNFFRKWVLHNLGLKLLALLTSFLVWATYTSEPFVEVGFAAPLEYLNIPSDLDLSGEVPTHAKVYVRGRSAVVRRVSPSDLAIQVNLSGTRSGETLVYITSKNLEIPFGLELVRISPSELRVRLAERVAR
jgi:hypothetical protein